MSFFFEHKHSFADLDKFFVAGEKLLGHVNAVSAYVNAFPPHNIVRLNDSTYRIEMAVAGYSVDDLDVTLDGQTLIIKGNRAKKENLGETVLWSGIAGRSFTRSFLLHHYVQVKDIDVKDGILTINLVYEIPESLKPKKLPIGKQLLAEYQDAE